MTRSLATLSGSFLLVFLSGCGSSEMSGNSGGGNSPQSSGVDVTTYKNDLARTGLNPSETILTTSNVNPATFGLLRTLSVTGKVDAQPLYLSQLSISGSAHNVVFVATEHDMVYAFDSDTGSALWSVSIANGNSPSDDRGCNQVTSEIGVTDTPVIDRNAGLHGAIYLGAMSKDAQGITITVCTRSTSPPAPNCLAGPKKSPPHFPAPAVRPHLIQPNTRSAQDWSFSMAWSI